MRTKALAVVLGGVLFAALPGLAQPTPAAAPARRGADERAGIEMQQQRIALQERQNQVEFQRQKQELDIEARRVAIEKQRAPACPPPMVCSPQAPCLPKRPWHRGPPCRALALLLPFCAVVHILVAVWVYQDIRRRNSGSGIWIVIALLTGLFGAAVYALTRIGDKPSAA